MGTTGKITEIIDDDQALVLADIDGLRREVSIAMLRAHGETADVGDWVHIHMGIALEKTDEAHAREAMAFQRQIESGLFPDTS